MSTELAGWLSLLACPTCGAALCTRAEIPVVCPNCRQRFGRERGILSLIPRKRRAELEALSIGYRLARLDEGWRPMTSRQLLALPHGSPKGYLPLYWKVRRQTFRAFSEFLQREGPVPDDGPAADIGAGTGWLVHRLAQRGYQTIALDASLDVDFGLGASAAYRSSFRGSFMPIQGDLDALPLQQALFGLVIFNASLHYAQDLAGTLHRAARALSPRGCLVVLDTPVAQRPHRGCEIGERHLGRRELGRSLSAAGLLSRHVRVRRGLRWHVYQLRAAARGNDRFFFPMVIASRHYKNDETA